MKTHRLLLLVLLAGAALLPHGTMAQERVIDIGVLVDQPPADLGTLFAQMTAEITAVVGTAATIRAEPQNVRANGYDPAVAETIYQEMVDGDIDVILAFGPVTSSVVSGRPVYEKPTVLFGGVNRDLLELPEGGATSGIPNFTYIISDESYVRDVQTLRSLYDFDRLGLIMPPDMSEAFGFDDLVRPLMTSLGVEYEIIDYAGLEAVDAALDGVDAVYLLESLFIPDAEIEALAQLLIERRIPSFSGARRDDVEMGLMATNQPRQGLESFFRRIALTVESVANGEDLANRTVFFEASPTLTVNFHTARAVGVPIRYSSVATTEFVGAFENPLAERTYSLIELIDEALASNLGLESGRRDVRLAEQDVRSAWSNYLPSVGATVTQSVLDSDLAAASQGQNPQYSTDGTLSVTQAVFSPDANAGIAIQRELAGAQRENLRAIEWDVVLDAASVYFTSLILKANLEIQARNTDATKNNLRIARQSFAAGQTGRGDVLRLESEAARDMQSLVDAVNALEQSFHAINELVNQPVDREIDVADISMEDGVFSDERFEEMRQILDDPSLSAPFEDFLAQEAVTNAPELRIFDYNIDAVGRSARLNGLERFLPTVAAGLDLNRSLHRGGIGAPPAGMGLDQYFTLGVSASIPLFDSNQRRIARHTSLMQQDQLRVDREGAALAIERAVRDVVLDLTTEIANIQLSAISESAAEEGLSLAQDAYASGAITLIELLDAQTNFLSAQLARASARYNFLATSVGLQRLVGHFSLLSSDELNDAYMDRFRAFVVNQGGPS